MFTPRDSDSKNTNHPASANEALRIIGSMIEHLTWGDDQHVAKGLRIEMRYDLFRLCHLFGLKTKLAIPATGGSPWESIRPKLLRHVTQIAQLLAKKGGEAFITYRHWGEEQLREMCEVLGLEAVDEATSDDTSTSQEDEATDTPPHLRPITVQAGETAYFVAGLGVLQVHRGLVNLDKPRKCYSVRLHPSGRRSGEPVPPGTESNAPGFGIAFENDKAILDMIDDLVHLLRLPL